MVYNDLKIQIGNNIAACRKRCGLTQAELAEKLDYSDKAVSKWERGDSLPDVITLMLLAQKLGVSVNELVGEVPPEPVVTEDAVPVKKANRRVIQGLVSLLVWAIALAAYVILSSLGIEKSWMGFVYAIPVNAIVLLSLRSAWKQFRLNLVLVSLIVWGTLASAYATFLVFARFNFWKLVLLGLIGQVAVCLWFRMFHSPKEKKNG